MIGSIVMVMFDPIRMENKKYLQEKYYSLNRKVGIIAIVIIIFFIFYFST